MKCFEIFLLFFFELSSSHVLYSASSKAPEDANDGLPCSLIASVARTGHDRLQKRRFLLRATLSVFPLCGQSLDKADKPQSSRRDVSATFSIGSSAQRRRALGFDGSEPVLQSRPKISSFLSGARAKFRHRSELHAACMPGEPFAQSGLFCTFQKPCVLSCFRCPEVSCLVCPEGCAPFIAY
uniref:Secreted protein n=1 Tax=Steinernema glaseri TaxID=37863 RepID=A0A1I7YHL9_9BILA